MRVFWTILAAAAGLVVLALVGVAIAVWTIDVNTFVGPIQQRVKDGTGRDLAIKGGIDLKLSLEPRLVIDEVSLGNAPWGKERQMLSAKRVEAQVALLPLLQRRFDIVRFKLVEPTIALETNADGRGNWEFGAPPPGAAAPAPPTGAPSLQTLGIGDLVIERGTMTYRDGATGNVTRIAIDELTVHARDPASPVSARFRGKVDDLALALEGNFGPLDQLVQRRWPYPIAVRGAVDGQQAAVSTKVQVVEKGLQLGDLDLALGSTKAAGQVTVETGGARPKLLAKLDVATLSLADLPLAKGAPAAAAPAASAPPSRYLFPDTPVPLTALRSFDADGDIAIGRLLLAEGRHVDKIVARFTLVNGRLEAPALEASAFGGSAKARLVLDASAGHEPTIAVHGNAQNVDVGSLLAAFGDVRDVKGGKTAITFDVSTHGNSPHQWMAGATGNVTASVGPASLSNTKLNLDSTLARLGDAVNPFRKSDPTTEVECVGIRLPLRDGVARLDRSIALETRKIGVIASGTLDFRNETLDLSFNPRVRQGIAIDIPQIAQLVRLKGTFMSPAVTVDAVASAATVARLGAVIGTGGWSLLGETLLSRADAANTGNLCQVALGRAPAGEAATSAPPAQFPAGKSVDEIGKALGKLLGR
jgi:AsmA family protein